MLEVEQVEATALFRLGPLTLVGMVNMLLKALEREIGDLLEMLYSSSDS